MSNPAWTKVGARSQAEATPWATLENSSFKAESGAKLTKASDGAILAGGAHPDRDSYVVTVKGKLKGVTALRLEACFPLHGQDITPETDAISAGLRWCCSLDKEFTGAHELREIDARGPARRLVPFVMEDRAIPRAGMTIEGGGEVTSGTHSPMLDRGIGMGYVPTADAQRETELTIDVRGRPRRARVVAKPIYKREESA